MNIDITSFFFNSMIEGATATAAWGTSVGQNQSKDCRIEDEKSGVIELLTGMLYKSLSDKARLDISAGSSHREVLLFSKFDKVYINNIFLEEQSFIMLLVRENTDSHSGRLIVSYPPYAQIDKIQINDLAIKKMALAIGCTTEGCWFVHDISVRNQDELHFSAIVVDESKPMIYKGKSRERSQAWAALVGEKKVYRIEELGAILKDMYDNAEAGKQVAMLYIFVFTYGEYLVDLYKSSEIINAAGLNPSYSTEIDKAYNIYRYASKKRLRFFKFGKELNPALTNLNQKIYFGTPGSGKSYKVAEIVSGHGDFTFRTTFHPDSDYATFVGAYKPVKNGDVLTYEFVPQVFTNAYVKAWNNSETPVYLIIEEINRGNCAQIFGDLFQLLDRDDSGVSEYPVLADTDLKKYLESDNVLGEGHDGIKNGKLRLPSNFHILATMNTSDQSLFPIDSAFKRRWAWEYVPIDYEKAESRFVITIGNKKYQWLSFLSKVNERIHSLSDSEDKQMGNFFIKSDVDVEEFKSKVMFYLWSEVCKEYERCGSFFIDKNNGDSEFTFNSLFPTNDHTNRLLQGFMDYLGVAEEQS